MEKHTRSLTKQKGSRARSAINNKIKRTKKFRRVWMRELLLLEEKDREIESSQHKNFRLLESARNRFIEAFIHLASFQGNVETFPDEEGVVYVIKSSSSWCESSGERVNQTTYCPTLAYKMKEARKVWATLGGAVGTGLADPDQIQDRKVAIAFLSSYSEQMQRMLFNFLQDLKTHCASQVGADRAA